jgi:DNA-binding Xre family transcriptional regulator
MTISYKKLWVMLAHAEMSKAELRRRAGLSPATFTKLRRNQSVSMEVLLKIAEVMNCNIGDMMDFVKIPQDNE